jgi:hypothetical protein
MKTILEELSLYIHRTLAEIHHLLLTPLLKKSKHGVLIECVMSIAVGAYKASDFL